MRFTRVAILIVLGILLLGYLNTHSSSIRVGSFSIELSQAEQLGQMLPVMAKANMGREIIELEVALTPEQQAMGLMYRTSLPDERGMLFPFSESRYTRFWMKNVVIPLDMIFLKKGVIQAIFSDVPPCKADPCPDYGPETLIDQVIELRGGRAADLGLKVGDQITIEFL